jgi:hypothetical protein
MDTSMGHMTVSCMWSYQTTHGNLWGGFCCYSSDRARVPSFMLIVIEPVLAEQLPCWTRNLASHSCSILLKWRGIYSTPFLVGYPRLILLCPVIPWQLAPRHSHKCTGTMTIYKAMDVLNDFSSGYFSPGGLGVRHLTSKPNELLHTQLCITTEFPLWTIQSLLIGCFCVF